ncbi:MAG TPA: DUF559 domain-containing protein [Thermoleophilaceae bacterium]|nr:DUF559 domain-containing protein [Thermoleophilaceae bacterium]
MFAVGHRRLSPEGKVAAALLYAGPGAALSHVTAAWWFELWPRAPKTIHVTRRGRRASRDGVRLHRSQRIERIRHRGFPVTTVERTLLDLAAAVSMDDLRRTLAEADYRRLLDLRALEAVLGPGRRGATALRHALAHHMPELARTRSRLERAFLFLCEAEGIPLPQVNVWVAGFRVDAVWRAERVAVELDGGASHARPATMESDRARDLRLRATGFVVLRYTWRQVRREPELVAADLRATLAGSSAT